MKANYTTVISTVNGTLGFRDLHDGSFRVRVEPKAKGLSFPSGWKVPDSYDNRFSTVVKGQNGLLGAVAAATQILSQGKVSTCAIDNAKAYLATVQSYLKYASDSLATA